jgi:hypothetical protein
MGAVSQYLLCLLQVLNLKLETIELSLFLLKVLFGFHFSMVKLPQLLIMVHNLGLHLRSHSSEHLSFVCKFSAFFFQVSFLPVKGLDVCVQFADHFIET